MRKPDWLIFERKVRFGDCDSAGVIHFHNLFRWSHEAWEQSLDAYGISYNEVFPDDLSHSNIIMPIVNSEGKFFSPIKLGDLLKIKIIPKKVLNHLFQIKTFFFIKEIKVAETIISHCVIENISRNKADIPHKLELWIEASNIKNVISEC
ncbi:MAG: 1,4-dihydroxy-2-naphthoyl-CoA hydrolase [Prochlorococcus sp. SP3034]|nr:1,4-dihydroxy-2-naphthoyl-CoA hydrolase [Prochlorococcus sp. SP3034]|tara:strand:+ start:15562 stop:16011 length:450 start_codon:yes stop_codon:yes gene_type:complete